MTFHPDHCHARADDGEHSYLQRTAQCVDVDVDMKTCIYCGQIFLRAAVHFDAVLKNGYESDWAAPVLSSTDEGSR